MTVWGVIALVEADGWMLGRSCGDHRPYKHRTKPGLAAIAGHRNCDDPLGTLANMLR